jgi:hypothetical protein
MRRAVETEFLVFPDLLKATPFQDGGKRIVYVEASNEARDFQQEVILAKALTDSAAYYLRYGNLDIDHITVVGPTRGIPNFSLFEIGRPIEVSDTPGKVFVKGLISEGTGRVAEAANLFWDSLTKLSPPQRWYPSVAGAVIDRDKSIDPETGQSRNIVKSVRWTNIGFSKTPVNLAVPTVSTVPLGAFAKCYSAAGWNLKALDSGGYGTDSATLTGGAALREQSIDRGIQSYWDFKERLARAIRSKAVPRLEQSLKTFAQDRYGLDRDEAVEWVNRFMRDVASARSKIAA